MGILNVLNLALITRNIFIALFLFVLLTCSAAVDEFNKVDMTHSIAYRDWAVNIIGKKALIIVENTKIYNNLSDLNIIGKINLGERVTIRKIDFDNIFKIKDEYFIFFHIMTDNNINGWIKSTSVIYPFVIHDENIYGVIDNIKYFEANSELISYLQIVYLDNDNKLFKDLFHLQKTGDIIYSSHFDVNEIRIQELNHDSIKEIVLSGSYFDGLWKTDAVGITHSEIWFNVKDNKVYEIFLKKEDGGFGVYEKWKYDNKLIDGNNDGFYDQIKTNYKRMMLVDFDKNSEPIYKLKETREYFYEWNDSSYVLSNYHIPTIDNLRLRVKPTTNGSVIRLLTKGDKLEIIQTSKTETIDGVKGTWVQVRTEKGEIGWCFDAYLEEIK